MSPLRRTPVVHFGHVALITPDLDRARQFYEDVIGLRTMTIDHPHAAPFRRLAALADGSDDGTMALLLFEVPGFNPGVADDLIGRRGRIDHLAFVAAIRSEFNAIVARLVDAGASSGRVDTVGPTLSVLFVDPDGGHHNMHTPNLEWVPEATTDVIDAELTARVLRTPTVRTH